MPRMQNDQIHHLCSQLNRITIQSLFSEEKANLEYPHPTSFLPPFRVHDSTIFRRPAGAVPLPLSKDSDRLPNLSQPEPTRMALSDHDARDGGGGIGVHVVEVREEEESAAAAADEISPLLAEVGGNKPTRMTIFSVSYPKNRHSTKVFLFCTLLCRYL